MLVWVKWLCIFNTLNVSMMYWKLVLPLVPRSCHLDQNTREKLQPRNGHYIRSDSDLEDSHRHSPPSWFHIRGGWMSSHNALWTDDPVDFRSLDRSHEGAIHSTKISRNFRPKRNGSVRSNRKSFEKTGPPFEVDHFSRSDRVDFWLNGSRPVRQFE